VVTRAAAAVSPIVRTPSKIGQALSKMIRLNPNKHEKNSIFLCARVNFPNCFEKKVLSMVSRTVNRDNAGSILNINDLFVPERNLNHL
jgi:hypothetical protein